MVFWSLSQVDVEDVMLALANRSLVERHTTNALTAPKESYRIHLLLHETLKKWNGPDVQKVSAMLGSRGGLGEPWRGHCQRHGLLLAAGVETDLQ